MAQQSTNAPYAGPDEFPIKEVPTTPWWSENFAAMYSSPADRLAVFYSIGRWHSDPSVWREMVMVSLPDSRVLYSRGYSRNSSPNGPVGPLSNFEIVEPGRKTRLTFDGPMSEARLEDLIAHGPRNETTQRCSLDLHFESAAPMWNMKGDSTEASNVAGSVHIDHAGTTSGSIEYEGHRYEFSNGYGVRDHSRGVREVSQYGGHNWINCVFPSGRAFYLYAMKSRGSDEIGMSNAAVAQDGEIYPAKLVHTEFITSLDGVSKTHRLVLDSELGQMEVEIVDVLNVFVSSMMCPYDTVPGTVLHREAAWFSDQSVRMRWNGEEAYGWAERGFPAG